MRRFHSSQSLRDSSVLRSSSIPLRAVLSHEIVHRVEALFKLADAIEKRVAAAQARADKLTQSILAKAFRGELVPTEAELARQEGRDYEPASVCWRGFERNETRRQVRRRNPTREDRHRMSRSIRP